MGLNSQFTPEQDAHISSFFPAWEATVGKKEATQWKKNTVAEILDSPLFKGKLSDEVEPKKWEERINQKFRNHKRTHREKTGGLATGAVSNPTDSEGVNPAASSKSFFNRPTLTRKRLFEIEQKDSIIAAADAARMASGAKRSLGFYQPAKKAMWDALSEEQQDDYELRAHQLKNDVGINQKALMACVWGDMDELVKSGVFGAITLSLFVGMRTPEDALMSGVFSVHSDPEAPQFQNHHPRYEREVKIPYDAYLNEFLPAQTIRTPEFSIPADEDGTPIFPALDIDATAPAALLKFLRLFFEKLWHHCRPSDVDFTWEKAAAHYNKTEFSLPVALELVGSALGAAKIIQLAQYLMDHRDQARFVFEASGGGVEGDDEQDKPKDVEDTVEKPKDVEEPVEEPKDVEDTVEKPKDVEEPVEEPKEDSAAAPSPTGRRGKGGKGKGAGGRGGKAGKAAGSKTNEPVEVKDTTAAGVSKKRKRAPNAKDESEDQSGEPLKKKKKKRGEVPPNEAASVERPRRAPKPRTAPDATPPRAAPAAAGGVKRKYRGFAIIDAEGRDTGV
ncbi:hypothetical protein DFH07DRAFT_777400 [Mycena maculata]|uniref:Uncharacterized protein n=1 Tax=Mycena maculata TaxID=230809 RepID=A0AAD7IHU8_9AGAR|nr:hypothetical protein DFH07DRAFT_777400 [Mycena maculata]